MIMFKIKLKKKIINCLVGKKYILYEYIKKCRIKF